MTLTIIALLIDLLLIVLGGLLALARAEAMAELPDLRSRIAMNVLCLVVMAGGLSSLGFLLAARACVSTAPSNAYFWPIFFVMPVSAGIGVLLQIAATRLFGRRCNSSLPAKVSE